MCIYIYIYTYILSLNTMYEEFSAHPCPDKRHLAPPRPGAWAAVRFKTNVSLSFRLTVFFKTYIINHFSGFGCNYEHPEFCLEIPTIGIDMFKHV